MRTALLTMSGVMRRPGSSGGRVPPPNVAFIADAKSCVPGPPGAPGAPPAAERRLPQDGAARLKLARSEIDIRVATMPTQHGESAVLRLLPRDRGLFEVSKRGLSPRDERTLAPLLALPHGLIVLTGPTGSGKTTTLATMLSVL